MSIRDRDIQGKREAILDYLLKHPGASMDLISRDLHITRGTLRYHLDVLMKREVIISKKVSGKKAYFHVDKVHRARSDRRIKLTTDQERVLNIVRSRPGISKKEIFLATNLTKRSVSASVIKLKETGLVWEIERDGERIFEPVTREMVLQEMVLDLVEMYLDGKVDQATFFRLKEKLLEDRNGKS